MPSKKSAPSAAPPRESTDGKYFIVGRSLPGDAHLMGIPGDVGALIPADKFTFAVSKDRFDKLVRLYNLSKYTAKERYECGRCGLSFASEEFRDQHGNRRHLPPRYRIAEMDDLTEEQKQRLKADAGRPNLTRADDDYYVNQGDFHIPDPSDTDTNRQDRQLTEQIDWSKTEASKQG